MQQKQNGHDACVGQFYNQSSAKFPDDGLPLLYSQIKQHHSNRKKVKHMTYDIEEESKEETKKVFEEDETQRNLATNHGHVITPR